MTDDAELLRRYAEEKSEDAFAELVRRHIDFVYAAALRQARGNAPLAQDVAQVVFTDLARKAASLARYEVVVGWLHTATRFAVAKAIRGESRRQAREQEAYAMNEALGEADAPVDWERLHPVLDDVLGELKERERAAILLRYFEKKPLAEVGAKLSLTETAARSCVDRALEKMRDLLVRRGVTSTSAALAAALANQVSVAAPAGLAASVTGAALASATSVGGAADIFAFMSTTKVMTGVAIIIAMGAMGFGFFQSGAVQKAGVTDALPAQVHEEQVARLPVSEAPAPSAKITDPGGSGAGLDRADAAPIETQREPAAVAAREPTKQGVTVVGAVQQPGFVYFPAEQDLTLLQAIVSAGGFSRQADKRRVSIRRINAENKREVIVVDVDAILKGKADDTWPLRPGDTVLVPEILF